MIQIETFQAGTEFESPCYVTTAKNGTRLRLRKWDGMGWYMVADNRAARAYSPGRMAMEKWVAHDLAEVEKKYKAFRGIAALISDETDAAKIN